MAETITSRYRLVIQHLTPEGWKAVDVKWFDDEFKAFEGFMTAPLPVGITGVTLTDMISGSTLYADNQAGAEKEKDIDIIGGFSVNDVLI